LVACWAWLSISYSITNAQTISSLDPTQVYNTGNLVNNGTSPTSVTSTWQNVGLMNQGLPCWAPGDPGCGPQPYFNQGSFNFSYGVTNVYQIANIAAALPNSGTGLRVNGYNFGFTAKNGNGWDGGRLDTLSAYVTFYGSDGNTVVRNDYYDLNYVFNWTTFNFSKTFDTPYANKDLSNVRYGFIGGDTSNYWAGPYGPEIYNINFSLKYSVDPCYIDVLSSPTCPGYLDALAKLQPPPPTTTDTLLPPPPSPPLLSGPSPSNNNNLSTGDSLPPPPPPPNNSPGPGPTATASATAIPSATNPQPKVGEVQVSGSQTTTTKSTLSTSQILSIVGNEQSRVNRLEMTTATAAVEQANQASAKVTSEAQAVAAAQQTQTLSNAQAVVASVGPQTNSTGSTGSLVQTQNSVFNLNIGSSTNVSSSTGLGLRGPESVTSLNAANLTNSIASTNSVLNFSMRNEQDNKLTNQESVSENKQVYNQTNPLHSSMNPAPTMPSAETPAPASSVNKNVKDNDIAGGINIASIARQPMGFDSYMNGLQDRPFYTPKEIYRNQTVIDNARAQRLLNGASDRLHQEMVEQQYRR